MTITDVRVRKVAKDGKMKAVVSITLDEAFVVHDIKVIEGEKGLFIAMPSRKTGRRRVPRYRASDQFADTGSHPEYNFGGIRESGKPSGGRRHHRLGIMETP